MAFFKFGAGGDDRDVVLELISPAEPGGSIGAFAVGEQPAIAGMVVGVPAGGLAPLAELLGDKLGEARPAVQGRGRMIAPLRHEAIGLPLPLAFMTEPIG